MAHFGPKSREKLDSCDDDLARLFYTVENRLPKEIDLTIVWGHRGEQEQNKAYESGNSKVKYPDSKHNQLPSKAVDFAPWVDGRIPWDDLSRFTLLAGFILAVAAELKIKVRWGGDWDQDYSTEDEGFMDAGHVELVD